MPSTAMSLFCLCFAKRRWPLPCIRIAALLELYPQRGSLQPEGFAEHIFQVTLISLGHVIKGAAMDDYQWGVGAALVSIAKFGARYAGAGRRLLLYRRHQSAGKSGGGQMRHRSGVGRINRRKQPFYAGAAQRGDVMKSGEILQERQLSAYFTLDRVALIVVQAIP